PPVACRPCLSQRPGGHRVLHSFPTRRSSDLQVLLQFVEDALPLQRPRAADDPGPSAEAASEFTRLGAAAPAEDDLAGEQQAVMQDRKSTRLNSSHVKISYAVFCLKKKNHPAA